MAEAVKWRTVGAVVGATALVVLGGIWSANASGILERPAPESTAVVQEEPTATQAATSGPTPTPTAAPVVAPVVEPAPTVEEPAAPEPAPAKCPSGSTPNQTDGVTDYSCTWDYCLTISVPNAAYPECDYAFEP